jgi:hypothetical protein
MSWGQLQAVLDDARQAADEEANRPPVACPNDGTLLDSVGGVLHCPFDGWTDQPLPPTFPST